MPPTTVVTGAAGRIGRGVSASLRALGAALQESRITGDQGWYCRSIKNDGREIARS